MKGRRSNPDRHFHLPRDTTESDKQTRIKNRARPKSFASTAPQYFVPSFSVRRKALKTPEIVKFVEELGDVLPRNYRAMGVGALSMTILEQGRLIERFRQADEHPEPETVEQVANKTARELGRSLQGVPRRLSVPTGRVDRFGSENNKNKVGVTILGWKGFGAHYAERASDSERGTTREVQPIPVIVREADLCVGGIVNAFGNNEVLERGIRADGISRTPHITIASKVKGGPISHSEIMSIEGMVNEVIPTEITLFDPSVHLRLSPDQDDPITIHARSPRMSRNADYL